jgi:hypothetical protein
MFMQSSFRSYSDSFNHLHVKFADVSLDRRRLADVFYTQQIIKFYYEHNIDTKFSG